MRRGCAACACGGTRLCYMVVVNPERLRGSERRHGHVEVRPLRLHQGKISELAQPLGMPFGLLSSLGLLVKVADDLAQEVGLRHEAAPARARTGIQAGAASANACMASLSARQGARGAGRIGKIGRAGRGGRAARRYSASKSARNLAEVCRLPASSAPALYPVRVSRRSTRQSTPRRRHSSAAWSTIPAKDGS